MTKNIVEFPKHKIVRENPIHIDIIEQAKEKGTQKYADGLIDDLITNIIADLENNGIDIDRPEFLKDFSLAADAMRAAIYRQFNLSHNLHDFIDKNIKMVSRVTGEPIDDDEDLDSED